MGLLLFLDQKSRFKEALQRIDPLEGEFIINKLDPINYSSKCDIPLFRIFCVFGGLSIFVIILSLMNPPFGSGKILEKGSLFRDYGSLGIMVSGLILPTMVVWGRRVIGDLVNTIELKQIVASFPNPFYDNNDRSVPTWLHWLDMLSSPKISISLMPIIWAGNAKLYIDSLSDNLPGWQSSTINPDSLFYVLKIGSEQPNISGILAYLVLWPLIGFMYVPAIRLFIMTTLVSYRTSKSNSLKILPAHPDGVGGLLVLGHASLFLSAMVFAPGFALTGMSLQWYQLHSDAVNILPMTIVVYWILYLVLGPILFFVPLVPLKKCMAICKRNYIISLRKLLNHADSIHADQLSRNEFDSGFLEGRSSLSGLLETAMNMSVWPLDKRTISRFFTFLVAPLAPLLGDKVPEIMEKIKGYFLQ